ncbi:GAF domain-containing sensor histidine kinase [Streptomyces catenulae]|uniref:histidine kinase n=1 Tax=Streptomyces catenulae TaxID=66875 RepID=A0ABV2Z658_9ACTN|nr:ATP-binding protein [Streptomyces catenulae]
MLREFDRRASLGTGPDTEAIPQLLVHHAQVLEMMAEGAPLRPVLDAVTGALEDLLPGTRCSVLLLDERSGRLHHGAAPSMPQEYIEEIDGMDTGPCAGSCGTAAYTAVPVVVPDIHRSVLWDAFRPAAAIAGVRACWSTPIPGKDGQVLGTFAVYHDDPHTPTEYERHLVERFTHLAAVAIDHDRLFGSLAQSEERFRRAFDDNAAGMALLGLDGRLLRVNRSLCALLRREASDLVGRCFQDLVQSEDRASLLHGVAAETGERHRFELRFHRPDAEPIVTSTTYSGVRDAYGNIASWCVNLVDETDRKAAEEERRARAEAEIAQRHAEENSRTKSQFLTALGHEIRTPLHAVVGFGEMLRSGSLTPERSTEALDRMGSAAGHLVDLVDDLSDVAAIEARALRLRAEPVPVGPLLADVHGLLTTAADEASVTFGVELPPGDPAVTGDERRLRQVLLNLATNAIKYNHPGGRVVLGTAPADGDRLDLIVTDDGPGIPRHLQHRLFVPFDRLGAERGRNPGSGLGLHVTKGLVDGMGGELTIESGGPAPGTVARVTLPTPDGTAARPSGDRSAPREA